ncbi:MAG: hypothetical protein ABFE16_02510 [Armatimonadia bacterium]
MTTIGTARSRARHARASPKAAVLRTATVTIAWALGVLLLLLLLSLLAETVFFRERRELYVVAMPARFLALSAEDFRAQHGRYPESPTEFASLADRSGAAYLDQVLEGARRVGVPVDTVSVPAPASGGRRALLVVSGGIDRIEVLRNGHVRVTEHLAPPPERRPTWLEVASS